MVVIPQCLEVIPQWLVVIPQCLVVIPQWLVVIPQQGKFKAPQPITVLESVLTHNCDTSQYL